MSDSEPWDSNKRITINQTNMKHILTLILLLAALTLAAQSNYSPCYTNNMKAGDAAYKQGKYSEAKTYYAKAKQCKGGNPTEAQKKINACDAKIKAQKEAAEAKRRAEAEAEEAKRKAEEEEAAIIARGYQEITVNGVTFKMIYVQGGTFTMGCTSEQGSDCYGDEKPTHSVTVESFWMGETEVTQALWQAVMGSNPSYFKGDNLPVEQVSWNDCQEFIRKLNQLTGKNFRLPTEAEWEYAARGGKYHSGYKYAGSNSVGDVAWYDGNSGNETHPVMTKQPNALGLYDMSGNVWEWCSDWYGSYSSESQTNPTGPSTGSNRVLRGGSWIYFARHCRVSYRSYADPAHRFNNYGFRLSLVR